MKNLSLLRKSIVALCLVLGVFALAFGVVNISNYYHAQKSACSLTVVEQGEESATVAISSGEYTFPSALEENQPIFDTEIFQEEVEDPDLFLTSSENSEIGEEDAGLPSYVTITVSKGSGGSATVTIPDAGKTLGTGSNRHLTSNGTCPVKVTINSVNTGYSYATVTIAGSSKTVYAGNSYQKTVSGSASVSVTFVKATYTISYNRNGGSGSTPSSQTAYYKDSITLSTGSSMYKTGYSLSGWSKSSSGTAQYRPGNTYQVLSSHTLYAIWSPIRYTVAYNSNGGTGSMSNQQFTYGEYQNLRSNSFSRSGCSFMGWATSSSGSVSYSNGQSVRNLTTTYNGTVNLYAVWGCTISFNANGGSGGSSQTVQVGKYYSMPSNPTRSNYTFQGWSSSKSATTASWTSGTKQANSATTWYAVWKPNQYSLSVTKDSNITSASASSYSINVGSSTNISATPATGYYFKNWTITSGSGTFGSSTSASTTFTPTANSTIKANSAIESYTIKFNSNSGSACSDITKTYGSSVSLPTPTRECYTFKGWYKEQNLSGTAYSITTMPDLGANGATLTLYAKWEVNKVDLTLNFDAGISKIQYKINNGSYVNVTQNGQVVENIDALSSINVVVTMKSGFTWSKYTLSGTNGTHYTITSGAVDKTNLTFQIKKDMSITANTLVNVELNAASDIDGTYAVGTQGGSVGFSTSDLGGTKTTAITHGGEQVIYAKPSTTCTFLGFYTSLAKLNDSNTTNDEDDKLGLDSTIDNKAYKAVVPNITSETIIYAVFKFITNSAYAYSYSSTDSTFGDAPDAVGGVVTVNTSAQGASAVDQVRYTTTLTMTPVANAGYKFIGWYESLEALQGDTNNTSYLKNPHNVYSLDETTNAISRSMPNEEVKLYAKFMKLYTVTLNYTTGIASFSISGASELKEVVSGSAVVANTAQFYYGQDLGSILCNVDNERYDWYKWEKASAEAPSLIEAQLGNAEITNITMPNYDFALTAYAKPKPFDLNIYAVYTDNGEYVKGSSKGGTVKVNFDNETASAQREGFEVTYGTNYAYGTQTPVSITATKNSDYTFVGWFNEVTGTFSHDVIENALSTNATMNIDTMTEEGLTYYAVFVKNYNVYVYFDNSVFNISMTNSVLKSTSNLHYRQATYYYSQPIEALSAEIIADGHMFKDWGAENGASLPTNFNNTLGQGDNFSTQKDLLMCASDCSLYPTFEYRTYSLYLKANYSDTGSYLPGTNGGKIQIQGVAGTSEYTGTTFKYKDKVTLSAIPNDGYAVYAWYKFSSEVKTLANDYDNLLNGEIINDTQITVDMDHYNVYYVALFKKTYTLELKATTGIASVSKTPEKEFYFYNEQVQIDANPTSGLTEDFDKWVTASTSQIPSGFVETQKRQTIIIQGNYSLVATSAFNYVVNYHIMTENTDGTYSESKAGGDLTGLKNGKMAAGMNLFELVQTNDNFKFDWFYTNSLCTLPFGNSTEQTAIMPADDLTVYLKFTRETFEISIGNYETLASDNNSVVQSNTKKLIADKYTLRYEETATLTANLSAYPGWELYGIYKDSKFTQLVVLGKDMDYNAQTKTYSCTSLGASDSNLTYYALFKRITYTIDTSKSHEEITLSVQENGYFGESISFTCDMPIYLTGLTITVTGQTSTMTLQPSTSGVYTFTMPSSDVTINAVANRPFVALTFDANGGNFGSSYVTNASGQVLGGVLYYDKEYKYYLNIEKTAIQSGVPMPERVGYTFLGFADENNTKYIAYNPEDEVFTYLAFIVNQPTTLYAVWEISTPELEVQTLKAETVAYSGLSQDVYKVVVKNQASDLNYNYSWVKVGSNQVVSTSNTLSVLNVVDTGSYVCRVVVGDKWAEVSVDIVVTPQTMQIVVDDTITYLKGGVLALEDKNLSGLLNVHTLQSGKLVFNDVDDIFIDLTLKNKTTSETAQNGVNIIDNYQVSLAQDLVVKEKGALFEIQVANYERTINQSTFDYVYGTTVLAGSSIDLSYSNPFEINTTVLPNGVVSNLIDDTNTGGTLSLGLGIPANYELVEVYVNGNAIQDYTFTNGKVQFVLKASYASSEVCEVKVYLSKYALVSLNYNLNPSEIVAGAAGYEIEKVIQEKGQNFVSPSQTTFFRNGFDFDGWYFTNNLSLKAEGKWSIVGETNLYAKWTLSDLSAQNLSLTISDNGNVVQNVNRAYNGEEVELSVAHIHPQVNLVVSWFKDSSSINKTINPLTLKNVADAGIYTFAISATFEGQTKTALSSDIALVASVRIQKAEVNLSALDLDIEKVYDASTNLYNSKTSKDYYVFETGVNNEQLILRGNYASSDVAVVGNEIADIQITNLSFGGINGSIAGNYNCIGDIYGKITKFEYTINRQDTKVYDEQVFDVAYTQNSILYPVSGIKHNIEYSLKTLSADVGIYDKTSGLYFSFVVRDAQNTQILSNNFAVSLGDNSSVEITKADLANNIFFDSEEITYDGTSHMIYIKEGTNTLSAGQAPAGASSVAYKFEGNIATGFVNAGSYAITAEITGDHNHNDKVLNATLTILKRDFSVEFFYKEDIVVDTYIYVATRNMYGDLSVVATDRTNKAANIVPNVERIVTFGAAETEVVTAIGQYTIALKALSGLDAQNFNLVGNSSFTFNIKELILGDDAMTFEDATYTYNTRNYFNIFANNAIHVDKVKIVATTYEQKVGDDFVAATEAINAGEYRVTHEIAAAEEGVIIEEKFFSAILTIVPYEIALQSPNSVWFSKDYAQDDPSLIQKVYPFDIEVSILFEREAGEEVGKYALLSPSLSLNSAEIQNNFALSAFTDTFKAFEIKKLMGERNLLLIKQDKNITMNYDGTERTTLTYETLPSDVFSIVKFNESGSQVDVEKYDLTNVVFEFYGVNFAKDCGKYNLVLKSFESTTHELVSYLASGYVFEIIPIEITITGDFDKVYDGTNIVDTSKLSVVGTSEEVEFSGVYADKNVSKNGNEILPIAITFETSNPNYKIANVDYKGKILPREITIDYAAGDLDKIYDKSTTVLTQNLSFSNVVDGDFVDLVGVYASANAANNIQITFATQNTNYKIVGSYLGNISPYEFEINLTDNKEFDGEAFATIRQETIYFANSNLSETIYYKLQTSGSEVGVYPNNEGNSLSCAICDNDGNEVVNENIVLTVGSSTYLEIRDRVITLSLNYGNPQDFVDNGAVSNNDITSFKVVYGTKLADEVNGFRSLPIPTKTGYDFKGWFVDNTFTSEFTENTSIYGENGIFAIANLRANDYEVALYAKWTIQTYSVVIKTYTENLANDEFAESFEGGTVSLNGVNLTNTQTTDSWKYYSNVALKITPTEHFYVEDILRNGESIYQNSNQITFAYVYEATGSIEIEIKLARETYNLTVNKNTPQGFTANDVKSNGDWVFNGETAQKTLKFGQFTTLPELSLTGQVFNGYSHLVSGIKEYITDLQTQIHPTSDMTFDAAWNSKTLKIYLNFFGGELESEDGVKVDGERYYIEVNFGEAFGVLPTPIRAGYVFDGYDLYDNGKFICEVEETTLLTIDSINLSLAATWVENANNVFNISKTLDKTLYGTMTEGEDYEVFASDIAVSYAVNNIAQMTSLDFTNNETSFGNVATNSVVYIKYAVENMAYKITAVKVDNQTLQTGDNTINNVLFNLSDNILSITNFTWGENAPQIEIVFEPNEVSVYTEFSRPDFANINLAAANGIFEENGLYKTYAGVITTINFDTKMSRELTYFEVLNANIVNSSTVKADDFITISSITTDFTIILAFDYSAFDVEIQNVGELSALEMEYALNKGEYQPLSGKITTKMTDVINLRLFVNWGYELLNSNWIFDANICDIEEISVYTNEDKQTVIEAKISNYEQAFNLKLNPTKRTYIATAQVGVLENGEISVTTATNNSASVNVGSSLYLSTLTFTAVEETEILNVGGTDIEQKVYAFVGWYEYKNLEFVTYGSNYRDYSINATMLGETNLIAVFEKNTFDVEFSVADSGKGGIYAVEYDANNNPLAALKKQTVVYGASEITASVQAIQNKGYDFIGWKVYFEYTDKNGAKYYADINNTPLTNLDIANGSILASKFHNSNIIGKADLGEIKANVFAMAVFEEYQITISVATAFDDTTEKANKISVGFETSDSMLTLVSGANNSHSFMIQTKSCHSFSLKANAISGYEFKGWQIEPNNQENYIINSIFADNKQESILNIQFLANVPYSITAIFTRATNNIEVALKTVDDSRIEGGLVGKVENSEFIYLPNTMTFKAKTEESFTAYFKVRQGYKLVESSLEELKFSLAANNIILDSYEMQMNSAEQELYSTYYMLQVKGFTEDDKIEIPITRGTTTFHFYDIDFEAEGEKFFDAGYTATIQYGVSTFRATNAAHLQGIVGIMKKDGYDFYGWSTTHLMQNIIFDSNNFPLFTQWNSLETDVDLYPIFDIRKVKLNVEVVPNNALVSQTLDYRELFNNILMVDEDSRPIISGSSFYFYAGTQFELSLPTTKAGYTFYQYRIKTSATEWKEISLSDIQSGLETAVFDVNTYDIEGNIYIQLVYGVNFTTEKSNYYLDNNRVNIIGGEVKVTSSLNTNYAPYGESITVTAIPEKGYKLAGWMINGINQNTISAESFNYTLTIPTTFKAIFIGEEVKVKFGDEVENGQGTKISGGNNISTNLDEYIFHVGDIITMFASANVGYDFKNTWMKNDKQVDGNVYLIQPEDSDVQELVFTPQFEIRNISIRVVALGGYGEISLPSQKLQPTLVGSDDVYGLSQTYDKDISFNINPDLRFELDEIKLFIDGEEATVSPDWLVGTLWTLTSGHFQNGSDFEIQLKFKKLYWYDYLVKHEIIAINDGTVTILEEFRGSGTSDDPYKIETMGDLALFAYVVNFSVPQTNTSKNNFNSENTYYEIMYQFDGKIRFWTPIGTANNPFSGKVFIYASPVGLVMDEDDEKFPYENFDKSTLKKYSYLFGYLSDSAEVEYTKPNYGVVYVVIGSIVGLGAILLIVIVVINKRRNRKIQSYNEINRRF